MKSKDYEYKYKMAEQYYANKQYGFAQQLFEDIFPYVKGTTRYEDMYYKFAYSYYYQKDYLNAENLFKSFVENFPSFKQNGTRIGAFGENTFKAASAAGLTLDIKAPQPKMPSMVSALENFLGNLKKK